MELLKVDSVQQAKQKYFNQLSKTKPIIEEVKISSALHRILAQPLYSPCMVPAFKRSTVDGYALISKDTYGSSETIPSLLTILGEVKMGHPCPYELQPGTCVYVPTGGMLPPQADAVIMIEYTELFGKDQLLIYQPIASKANVVNIGEDTQTDQLLLSAGHRLTASDIGALASVGISRISVYQRPKMTLLSTGDEIISYDQVPQLGQIRDINTILLAQAASPWFEIIQEQTLPDDEQQLTQALLNAYQTSDVIMISGGSSQGQKDLSARLLHALGTPGVFTHGIAMKPGKPTILGFADEVGLIGLPGHPVAALLVFYQVVIPCYRQWYHTQPPLPILAQLTQNVIGGQGREVCQCVQLSLNDNGYTATPIHGKSGLMSTLLQADGYLTVDALTEGYPKGAVVQVHLLKENL
jgi:molybdopterin molybdotransferase